MHASAASGNRLTPSEAESLWRAWTKNGDARARDHLILSYTPMVRYLASRKVRELPAHCDLDDLISCGLVALVEAVDRFDPAKGASFEEYAWTRVAGSIIDELRRQDWAPRSVRRMGRKIERANEALYSKEGRSPSDGELASEIGIEVGELRTVLKELDRAELLSLNAPARGGDEVLPLEVGDTVEAGTQEFDPERALYARERITKMREAIASLSERERQVLTLVHVQELPGAEIGRMLGVTESRVSQILSGARTKLRASIDQYEAAAQAVA